MGEQASDDVVPDASPGMPRAPSPTHAAVCAAPTLATPRALALWLRLLSGRARAVLVPSPARRDAEGGDGTDGPATALSARGLRLAAMPPEARAAAVAHAAAHLAFSGDPRLPRQGLVPITQALVGLLEDARCEHLACRELPGLRRLWLRWHRATPEDGGSIEALMARLARALLDPRHADPHPWIAKGRALCFADGRGEVLLLRQPEDLRRVASRLGHDLGQMRLGFNPRRYRPAPVYRDDNRWLWADGATSPEPAATRPDRDEPPPDEPLPPDIVEHQLPEWDRLIGRLRPRWCRLLDTPPPRLATADAPPVDAGVAARLARQLAVGGPAGPVPRVLREWGDELDLDGLQDSLLRRRAGECFAPRPYRSLPAPAPARATLLLVDASASGALALGPAGFEDPARRHGTDAGPPGIAGRCRLDYAREVAATLAAAFANRREPFALVAFRSDGRRHVEWLRLLDFDAPWDDAAARRLGGLAPAGSTRLGTALRQAGATLARRPEARRRVLVIGDGEPHDIDLHDPRYLVDDARQAVAALRHAGLEVTGLGLGAEGAAQRRRIFGAAHAGTLRPGGDWARQLVVLCR